MTRGARKRPTALQQGGTLGRLFALSEAYPDLKANQNMLSLQEELTSTENKIGFARQAFNDAATDYNIRREVFPAVKVAGMFGFKRAALLETAETERAAPKVSPFFQVGVHNGYTFRDGC